jgi:short-subunit dehydrogenase
MDGSKTKKKIAIITGASSGMGAEFALQVEASYYLDEVWLIARRQEPMRDLARRFQKSKAVLIAYDLSSRNDLVNFEKKLEAEQPQIEVLVNNAGYGKIGPVEKLGTAEQMQMIDVNIYALTYLTKVSLPYMVKGSKILQVASSIGYCPAPFFTVYAATKAYVVSFSEALNHELKPRGIQCTAVCPGPVATEFFDEAVKNEYLKDKNTPAKPFNDMLRASAHEVVEKALADTAKGRHRSIFGFQIGLFVFLLPFIPQSLLFRALEKRNQT